MPPPSSGGIHLVQILNTLSHFDLNASGHNSAQTVHIMAEAMKNAYADRSKYLGDPDFVKIPYEWLTSPAYGEEIALKLPKDKARKSRTIKPGTKPIYESNETTHYSVIDKNGNAVSNTYTLNFSFGSNIMVPGTGILLNNEMDDFSSKPGHPNAYGLVGGSANAVQPEKRMLSSMTPTLVLKDDKIFMATGSPGGSRIITTVLQILLNVTEHNLNIAEASYAPRIHHQWLPDILWVEKGISPDTIDLLKKKGHRIRTTRAMGGTQSIIKTESGLYGSSDPRKPASLTVGY